MGDPVLNDIEFDGDQSNLRFIYIDDYVPKYTLKSKRLMHDYMFIYRCTTCDRPISKGSPLDEVLYNCYGEWRRTEVHASCAIPRKKLDKFVPIKDKAPNSGKVLLLLEYLGLPRDLSWPIVAMAYWLL